MGKIKVKLDDCSIGDILAEDIIDERGSFLVAQNTIINQYIKEKLEDMGLSWIRIYHPLQCIEEEKAEILCREVEKNYKEAVLQVKEVLRELATGGSVDYEQILTISKLVTNDVNESNVVIKYLAEIKDFDEYTYTHCVNVSFYSMLIARWISLPEDRTEDVVQAALLHDIGKSKIPNEIINKKGKLTEAEFEVMKKHSQYGYEMIKDMDEFSEDVKRAVLCHHERVDGSGYPQGLGADAIGLYSKIVSIADVYDAMTQNRVYKKKVSPFEVFQMFNTIGISTFDIGLLKIFMKNISTLYIGTNVLLSNGDMGEIVYVPPQDIVSPVIHVKSSYVDLSKEKALKIVTVV